MAYTAVLEARREAEGKFQILAEGLRLKEEQEKRSAQAAEAAGQGQTKPEDRK
ncbi:hypothetical protein [Mesorhizobium helmanticense]|uniref:hypothetical protein n=1 Tax=Mesorhizobium helmanticense TaxID=1776423 RepID=UPI00142E128D|nr:hypothetical protein [Mesorhizobium helmanticense]